MITSRGSALASSLTWLPWVSWRSLMVNRVMVSSPTPVTSAMRRLLVQIDAGGAHARLHRLQQLGLGGIIQPDHRHGIFRRSACCRDRISADRSPARNCNPAPPRVALGGPIWVEQTLMHADHLGRLGCWRTRSSRRCRASAPSAGRHRRAPACRPGPRSRDRQRPPRASKPKPSPAECRTHGPPRLFSLIETSSSARIPQKKRVSRERKAGTFRPANAAAARFSALRCSNLPYEKE